MRVVPVRDVVMKPVKHSWVHNRDMRRAHLHHCSLEPMARNDAGKGRNSWDFDLPDLGESTTPARQRTPKTSKNASAAQSARATQPTRPTQSAPPRKKPAPQRNTPRSAPTQKSSPDMYRRRRVTALALIMVTLAAIGFGVFTMLTGQETTPEQPTAAQPTNTDPFSGFSPRADTAATDGASGPAARSCGESLKITASTDKEKYGGDDSPLLMMSLENTGDQPCMVNAGTARMNFSVSSGSETVFDSAACQVDGQDRPIEIQPGHKETARLEWKKRHSVPDCATEGPEANPGTYRLTVGLGQTRSEGVEFTLE